ncbi:MAG TPA: ZPR1 zinc finger domain-containing protein [Methanolinea sp.]|nr:ZPR1 zinc finger domain-containing protein [Methanolinea sp.]HOS81893.1 ZPR1 zinc finger domain-containing protein [Methanolinea sp.]HPC55428.1 ZPR1 zinc finger domain-containing protein [Methanolinea sp.]HQE85512.1 ZPR1 zinc finger domain-containing protein [Methanolinea sp.]HQI14365.1 ZPR1 zinc finger domain-containing protein [Methanolinea sp.]
MRKVVPGPCPVCNTEIEYIYQTEDIPYFFGLLIISTRCPSCGFRFVDTQLMEHAEPSRWEFSVVSEEDLSARVVRSMNGTITIPELGVEIAPGPACEGFVSNVEGVLDRVERVVESVILWAEDEDERGRARALREKIASARDGRFPVTLVIEDPTGNSAILDDRALVYPLTVEPDGENEGQET